jgi:hypothetical protein
MEALQHRLLQCPEANGVMLLPRQLPDCCDPLPDLCLRHAWGKGALEEQQLVCHNSQGPDVCRRGDAGVGGPFICARDNFRRCIVEAVA